MSTKFQPFVAFKNHSIAALKSGTYYVAAIADGFILSPSVELKVSDGGIGSANFIITPAPSPLLGSISGKVTNDTDPLHDVLVTLVDITTGEVVAITTTIEDGEYAFYDLINNEYSLLFVKSRYYPYKVSVTVSDVKKLTILMQN